MTLIDKSDKTCYYCENPGHFKANCLQLKVKIKAAGLVREDSHSTHSSRDSDDDAMKGYATFITDGTISVTRNGEAKPIRILGDTGASVSLVSESTLPDRCLEYESSNHCARSWGPIHSRTAL